MIVDFTYRESMDLLELLIIAMQRIKGYDKEKQTEYQKTNCNILMKSAHELYFKVEDLIK